MRILATLLLSIAFASPAAAEPQLSGSIRVTVEDPSGAVIPGAAVRATGPGGSVTEAITDPAGGATLADLAPGRYVVTVSFDGFETATLAGVRVKSGEVRRRVTLAIARHDESVSVGRDPATAASDPNSGRFGSVLSRDQIDALPDDPDEMEAALNQMAGPGAMIRVDGFRGGKLPPKSQIRSIRFSSGMFSAENHTAGMTFVDIVTQPGLGPLQVGLDSQFRTGALNARNAFQPVKGPEETQQYSLNVAGTLVKNRTSFNLSAGGASLYDSANLFAATPAGNRFGTVRRPADRLNVSGRIDQVLSKTHTLRVSFQQDVNDQQDLGVGTFDLPDRAYSRDATDRLLRVSESGPIAKNWFAESRVQLHSTSASLASAVQAPTVRVLDAFTSGGAQQDGRSDSTEVEWATNVDYARKGHAIRVGTLLDGGTYRSDVRANAFGTFTFPTLADYEADRPSLFTQRVGDPAVGYSMWQLGAFAQDDWRARKNLTVSGGVRYEVQSHAGGAVNLAPRAGITWAPFKSGRTTVRAGAGVFYDWLDADTYVQTLQVDGVRQQELLIVDPSYPDPFAAGSATELPPSRYALGAGLVLPRRRMAMIGITQQLVPNLMLNIMYNRGRSDTRLRGRNINAPVGGVRPDPALGNVVDVEAVGRSRGSNLNVGINYGIPEKHLFLFANYAWLHQYDDSDGPFSLPADNYDLGADWGRAAGVPRHVASGMFSTALPHHVRVAASATARSGLPYTITTGRDDNGDTVFNDRPAGVGRNSATGGGMWDAAARVSYSFGFGSRGSGAGGGTQTVMVRIGGQMTAGDLLGAVSDSSLGDKRVRFELYASAQNLFNSVATLAYSGVMTSPFFGRATAAASARKVDFGVRIGF